MDRGYNIKLVREEILRARAIPKETLLNKEKEQYIKDKITFIVKYLLAFQNIRNILKDLTFCYMKYDEDKKLFSKIPTMGNENLQGRHAKDSFT